MTDIPALVGEITATRQSLLDAAKIAADARSGMTAIRPAVTLIETQILPALTAATAQIEAAGVTLSITHGWNPEAQFKSASVAIVAQTAGDWPVRALGDRVTIRADANGLRVTRTTRGADPQSIPASVPCEPGNEVEAALRVAVETMLVAASAVPKKTGIDLRLGG